MKKTTIYFPITGPHPSIPVVDEKRLVSLLDRSLEEIDIPKTMFLKVVFENQPEPQTTKNYNHTKERTQNP